jgi:uncharacterized membrane protein
MKLTPEQMAKGRMRFLAGHPEAKKRIDALTDAEASALGFTLDELRESETMRELRAVAHAKRIDSAELFWSCALDTAEEFAAMLEHRDRSVKEHLGL